MRGKAEAKLIIKFRDKLLEKYPNAYIYKLPDTLSLGGRKPFDLLIIIKGLVFCCEAKTGKNKLTPYQDASLKKAFEAGANIIVLRNVDKAMEEVSRAVGLYK
jgi:hypothetical protein